MVDDDNRSTVSSYLSAGTSAASYRNVPNSAPAPPRNFKLPEYWSHAPDLWFARAEFRFEVVGVTEERDKFAHVVEALTYDSLKMVKDLMLSPPKFQPYQALKARLLLATQLTPVQMAEKLMKAPDLGDRRPSQLLAALLEYCPQGEENTALFRAAYLMRLPADIRGHLDGMEHSDLKELAAKADRHWCNRPSSAAATAAMVPEPADQPAESSDVVAAINNQKQRGGGSGAGQGSGQGGSQNGGHGGGQSGGQSKRWRKKKNAFICDRHRKFGKDCFVCEAPNSCAFSKSGN